MIFKVGDYVRYNINYVDYDEKDLKHDYFNQCFKVLEIGVNGFNIRVSNHGFCYSGAFILDNKCKTKLGKILYKREIYE